MNIVSTHQIDMYGRSERIALNTTAYPKHLSQRVLRNLLKLKFGIVLETTNATASTLIVATAAAATAPTISSQLWLYGEHSSVAIYRFELSMDAYSL